MPTREQISAKIERDLADRGVKKGDANYEFVKQTLEDMNGGMADLDDELADLADRITWLLNVASWVNERPVGEFERFVEEKLGECERGLAAIRKRWQESTKDDVPEKRG